MNKERMHKNEIIDLTQVISAIYTTNSTISFASKYPALFSSHINLYIRTDYSFFHPTRVRISARFAFCLCLSHEKFFVFPERLIILWAHISWEAVYLISVYRFFNIKYFSIIRSRRKCVFILRHQTHYGLRCFIYIKMHSRRPFFFFVRKKFVRKDFFSI